MIISIKIYCINPIGIREGDERNKFTLPSHLKLEILESFKSEFKVEGKQGSGLFELFKE